MTAYQCPKCMVWIGTERKGNKNWLKHKCSPRLNTYTFEVDYFTEDEWERLCDKLWLSPYKTKTIKMKFISAKSIS